MKPGHRYYKTPILIGAAALFITGVFTAFYIYPVYMAKARVQTELEGETAKLRRLETLFPVQARAGALEKVRFSFKHPLPESAPVPRRELPQLPDRLARMAGEEGLELSSVEFDLNALTDTSRQISVTLSTRGGVNALRQFLIRLIRHRAFDGISRLDITPGRDENRELLVTLGLKTTKASQ
ncbi:MAG: type II secretion system protein M [Desulfobacterales bacterium]|nr:type II secretion system protein M [Desulfobacterales bacterium]